MYRVSCHNPTDIAEDLMPFRYKHVIFDRDGVLNAEPRDGGYVRTPEQWQWLPGVPDSLAMLSAAGICISVATNQAGIGRGLFTRHELDAIHARMLEEAAQAGAIIDRVFVCPHTPEQACDCRKPAPGLLLDALAAGGIPRHATVLVGDDMRDLQAASAADIPAALVRTGKGTLTEAAARLSDVPVFDDVAAFTSALLSGSIVRHELKTP
jgi:D-glycero-D-manno-heptose 1,7-bisphosphate phosphatase